MRVAAPLVLLLLRPGCAAPSKPTATVEPWTPLPCDAGGPHEVSRSAVVVAGMLRPADEVAQRVVAYFGGELQGLPTVERQPSPPPRPAEEGPSLPFTTTTWATQDGHVRVVNSTRGVAYIEYERKDAFTLGLVRGLAVELGADAGTLQAPSPGVGSDSDETRSGTLGQVWQGKPVDPAFGQFFSANWWEGNADNPAHLNFFVFYDFLATNATVSADRLDATVRAYSACSVAAKGWLPDNGYTLRDVTNLGWSVVRDSLAFIVEVDYDSPPGANPCGAGQWVYVDILTGAVVAARQPSCLP
jgi:hypothetical protein